MSESAFNRGVMLARCVLGGLPLSTRWIRARFKVSRAAAKRDIAAIGQRIPLRSVRPGVYVADLPDAYKELTET